MRRTVTSLAFALTLPALIAAGEPPRTSGDALETAVLVLQSLDNCSRGPLAGASWLAGDSTLEPDDPSLPHITVTELTVAPKSTRVRGSSQLAYYEVRMSLLLDCPSGFEHGVRALDSCLVAFDHFNGDDLSVSHGALVVDPKTQQIEVGSVRIQLPLGELEALAGLVDGPRTHVSERIASAQFSTRFSMEDSTLRTVSGDFDLIQFQTFHAGATLEECGRLFQRLAAGPGGITVTSLAIKPFRESEEEPADGAEPGEPVADAEQEDSTWELSLDLLVGAEG